MERILEALSPFGEYVFADKGPYEVINIKDLKRSLSGKSIEEISEALSQVLDNYPNERYSQDTVNCIISSFDRRPDFDDFFKYDDRFEY